MIPNRQIRSWRRYSFVTRCGRVIANCLGLLLPVPLLDTGLPSGGQAALLSQRGRQIAHLLDHVWQRRAPDVDIIEDVVPLYDVPLSVPVVLGHQMVVLEG